MVSEIILVGGAGFLGGFSTGGPDIAEVINVSDGSITAGDIIALDNLSVTARKSNLPYDSGLIGVVSTQPGYVMFPVDGMEQNRSVRSNERLLALAGRVPVKVNGENGPIHIGDCITASSIAGVGMRANSGKTVGIALENFDGAGVGKILVLINIGQGDVAAKMNAQEKKIDQLQIENEALSNRLSAIEKTLSGTEAKVK